MSLRPAVIRRLMRELTQLKNEPPEGIRVVTPDENMLDVTGLIQGPAGTPYEGGYFKVKFRFTEEFPAAPPKCWFATKIFHPNVSSSGEICVNTLKKDWQSSYGIGHILVTVKCLLIYPNPESALDEEAGKLLLENYESYCDRARLITRVHASPKVRPVEFDTPSSSETPSEAPIASTSTSEAPSADPISIAAGTPPVVSPSLSTTTTFRKSASPAPPMHPLQLTGNTFSLNVTVQPAEKDKENKSMPAPSPLGTADSNAPTTLTHTTDANVGATKAMKRPAGSSGGAAEKRKKALKRL
ncbi:hypothetical protein BD410DRAFT_796434 [Rickenella mellea]|uniref:E2 ubiquitin-conjugating enzyme n=1 Tax=Rickenella mellea TaxID=50990 RepID=A0A4Y7PK11_9AGAM|nr:hypothetical protein BD410DRAFT_796434 [Rickenella mellea]